MSAILQKETFRSGSLLYKTSAHKLDGKYTFTTQDRETSKYSGENK